MNAVPAIAAPRIERPPDKGPIERLLSPVADIHRGEVVSVLLMTLTMFLMLGAYYLLKTAREGFILSEGGAEVKSYSSAGQAVMLLFLVPAYGVLASRVNRVQLVQWVTVFFASNLGLFLLALSSGLRIGVVFFLWLGWLPATGSGGVVNVTKTYRAPPGVREKLVGKVTKTPFQLPTGGTAYLEQRSHVLTSTDGTANADLFHYRQRALRNDLPPAGAGLEF